MTVGARDTNLGSADLSQLEKCLFTGSELLRQNRVKEARQTLLDALDIDADNVRALGLIGLACFRMNDFAGALPIYQRLVSLNPNDASFSLNLGLVHLKLGNAQEAIRELALSRDLDPSQGRAVSYLGLAYARNGQYAEAYQTFLQAGQAELAKEMEQYLSEVQRETIREKVAAMGRGTGGEAPPAGAQPRPPRAETHHQPLPVTPALSRTNTEDSITLVEDMSMEEIVEPGDPETAPVPQAAPPQPIPRPPEARSQPIPRPPEARSRPIPRPPGASSQPIPRLVPPALENGVVSQAMENKSPGVISQAVANAAPANTSEMARVAPGHRAPQPLSEFATARLIRPEDGDHTFEISADGVLIIRVQGRVFTRTEGVNVSGGELAYEAASRRARGSSTGENFITAGRPLFIVQGHGHLLAAPLGEHFTAVTLDEDILYLREDLVYAFEEALRWETGSVPGSGSTLSMVQFRGQGAVAMRSRQPLLSIKLAPEKVLYIDAQVLAGWIGRVIPRAVAPVGGGDKSTLFVECTGEGVVLIEDETERSPANGERPVLAGVKPIQNLPAKMS